MAAYDMPHSGLLLCATCGLSPANWEEGFESCCRTCALTGSCHCADNPAAGGFDMNSVTAALAASGEGCAHNTAYNTSRDSSSSSDAALAAALVASEMEERLHGNNSSLHISQGASVSVLSDASIAAALADDSEGVGGCNGHSSVPSSSRGSTFVVPSSISVALAEATEEDAAFLSDAAIAAALAESERRDDQNSSATGGIDPRAASHSTTTGQAAAVSQDPPPSCLPDNDYEKPECCVCLDHITSSADAQALSCMHVFHRRCIGAWLEKKRTCPVCKRDADTGELELRTPTLTAT